MTTQYTPILKIALPVTGELSGTWGDVVNDNITSMFEQAIAGLATINTWSANAHTLTSADGTTSESRCAMLVAADGAGLSAAGEIICPAASKLYVLKNGSSYAITLKTSGGSGVAVAAGETAFLFCDGTNVNSCVTTIVDGHITGNLTVDGNATINGNTTLGNATSDTITATARFASGLTPSADNTYDLGSSGNSWKDVYIDGTAYLALVDINGGTIDGVSIGATTAATIVNVDNLRLDGNTLSSTDTNGNVVIAPNGTGDVQLDADTVRVGDSGAAATLTSNGAGELTVTTGGAANLVLSTNSGTDSGTIQITQGANANIIVAPNGTGDVILSADTTQLGDNNTDTYLTTNGTGNLNLTTNGGTNSGVIQIAQGANGNITLTPNGTGSVSVPKLVVSTATATRVPYISTGGLVVDSANLTFNGTDLTVSGAVNAGSVNATTLDLTNLEVTNIKAKDGTASITLADSTGVASFTANPTLSAGTANGVAYLNGSKVLTSGSALTFDGTNTFGVNSASATTIAIDSSGGSFLRGVSFRASGAEFGFDRANSATGEYRHAIGPSSGWGGFHTYYIDGSERMRLTSTGLGIGTSSPAYPLDVVKAGSAYIKLENTANANKIVLGATGGSGNVIYSQTSAGGASALSFFIGASQSAVIDTSGNLGLGVTPSAWGFGGNLELPATNNIAFQGSGNILANSYYSVGSGAYVYKTSGTAGRYQVANTEHRWYNAPSGTAGDAISFTQAMTLNSSGNLGIGTSSPGTKLSVQGTQGTEGAMGILSQLLSTTAYNASPISGISLGTTYNSGGSVAGMGGIAVGKENATDGNYAGYLALYTRPNGGSTTERLRIDSSGNVGIGTSSPSYKLDVSGDAYMVAAIKTASTGATAGDAKLRLIGCRNSGSTTLGGLEFHNQTSGSAVMAASVYAYSDGSGTGGYLTLSTQTVGGSNTERARIDSSGNFYLGVTSATNTTYNPKMQVNGTISAGYGSDATNGVTAIATTYGFGGLSTFGTAYGGRTVIGFACQPLYNGGGLASSVSYPYSRSALILTSGNVGGGGGFLFQGATSTTTAIGTGLSVTTYLAGELDYSVALQGASSAAGTGITFPATQSASSNANTLDDYEEGTWTPYLTVEGGTGSMPADTIKDARYTKIGRAVTVSCSVSWNNYYANGGNSALRIVNLPFSVVTTGSGDVQVGVGVWESNNVTGSPNTPMLIALTTGATSTPDVYLMYMQSGVNYSYLRVGNIPLGTSSGTFALRMTFQYQTAT